MTGFAATHTGSLTPSSDPWTFDLSTVWEIGDTYQLRCTDAGGHEGVSVRAVWANLGG